MLSIGRMGRGQSYYYTSLAQQEDYYLKGLEPPGRWIGEGAKALGLSDIINHKEFHRLFHGFSADGRTHLVQNATVTKGPKRHNPGWDCTFSAPKSLSALWSQADPQTRTRIEALHFEAVKRAVGYLETVAGHCRIGKDGLAFTKASLVVATFEHGTSRALEPQLHTHALVLNIGVDAQGETRALWGPEFFHHKMTAGAFYRAELASLLEQGLHVGITRDGSSFAVEGIPKSLCDEYSSRREEIVAAMKEDGVTSAQAAAVKAVETRAKKESVPRDELFARWQEQGAAHGYSWEQHREALSKVVRPERSVSQEIEAALHTATAQLSQQRSFFSERDLFRKTLEEAQGRGIGGGHIVSAFSSLLQHSPELVPLAERNNERQYTTRHTLALETKLVQTVNRLLENPVSHAVKERIVEEALSTIERKAGYELNDEQRRALAHLTSGGAFKLLSGMAGVGKTTLLDAAREAWERAGYRVLGVAFTGKAADELREGAGIASYTIAKFLKDVERVESDRAKIQSMQALQKEIGEKIGKLPPQYASVLDAGKMLRSYQSGQKMKAAYENITKALGSYVQLTAKTVIVLDESGMVGTKDMLALSQVAARYGVKFVLTGDAGQLQSIDAGGAFLHFKKSAAIADTPLTTIVRQKEYWAREAIHAFAAGKAEQGLEAYQEHGLLHVAETRKEAMHEIVRDWKKGAPDEALIFTSTRQEASTLNQMIQKERYQAGALGTQSISLQNQRIYEKDRIMFLENSTRFDVTNGEIGTVTKIDLAKRVLHVKKDRDKAEVLVPYQMYREIGLAYAATTHKGQGVTVKRAYVLAGGQMQDREMSYVQMSRAQEETRLYTERRSVWDDEKRMKVDKTLEILAGKMSRTNQKELAITLSARAPRFTRRQTPAPSQDVGGVLHPVY